MSLDAWKAGVSTLACLVLGLALTWWVTDGLSHFTSESWRRAEILAQPRPIPDVALQDHAGHETSLGTLCGKVLVIDFIYTRCPTVCRSQGGISSQLARHLSEQAGDVQVLSISFDPHNDTPEALNKFKQYMEPSPTGWHLARPTRSADRQALLKTFGVVVIPDGYGGYDHNAALHIVNQCRLVRIMDPEDIPGAVNAVRTLIADKQH
jgi:protein SCO1/2